MCVYLKLHVETEHLIFDNSNKHQPYSSKSTRF